MTSGNLLTPPSPTTLPFDYQAIKADVADDLREVAGRIRGRLCASIIETGRDLLQIKDKQLEHGQFTAWVEAECGLSPHTAQRMMAAAQWVEGKNDTVSHLPPTMIYLLSSSSTPPEIHDAVMTRINAGERV